MSVRQYIGARYVPIFFDNNGSSEWVANHAYEPLTIVTYLGNSYTSKKLVTPDIGNPASNSEYWASTGIYNSQVEQYRQEVQELAEDVDGITDDVEDIDTRLTTAEGTLQSQGSRLATAENDIDQLENTVGRMTNRKILFIGDSYATGSGGGYSVTPWVNLVAQHLGLTSGSWWNYSRGGASFGANDGAESSPTTGNNYCDLLRKASNELPASVRATVTDICIGGSINDWSKSDTQIQTGIANFKSLASEQFPNAKITFCNIAGSAIFNYKIHYYHDSIRFINKGCGINGIQFKRCDIDMLQNITLFNADGVHPTQNGQTGIAYRVAVALQDGDPNFSTLLRTIGGLISGVAWCDGNNYYIKFTASQRAFESDTPVTLDTNWNKISEFESVAFTGYDTDGGTMAKWKFCLPCCIRSGGTWYNGVLLECEFRQSSNDLFTTEMWARQIGHYTGNAFTTFAATSLMPTDTVIVIPIWAI